MSNIRISRNLISILIGVLVAATTLSAQNGLAPGRIVDGYVIQSNGDTLIGQLKWRLKYVENNPVEIKFISENGVTNNFNASEIYGFGNYTSLFKEDFDAPAEYKLENYESKPSFKKGIPVFYNRLLAGRMTVFQNRSSNQLGGDKVEEISKIDGIAFDFSSDEGLSVGPSYMTSYRIIQGRPRHSSYYVEKNNQAFIKIKKDNYETVFSSLFGDCPEIQLELENNPDLRKFKNFILLAEVYNQLCMEP
jgi:hypothetical protein